MKILLIEDSKPAAYLFQMVCQELKNGEAWEVDIAEDMPQAEAMMERTAYDVLAVDLNLPGSDWRQTVEWMRLQSLPMTVYSSETRTEIVRQCLEAGASSFIAKGSYLPDIQIHNSVRQAVIDGQRRHIRAVAENFQPDRGV